jgi:preprotein translocase subunit SecE
MIRVLWIIAVIALILWLVGSLFRGGGERRYAL